MTKLYDTDVIVAGGGPTGLLLASELALAGVAVTVLEKRAEPDTTIKAGSISVATAEILDRRGLRPAARAASDRYLEMVAAFVADKAARTGRTVAMPDSRRRSDRQTELEVPDPRFPVNGHFAGMFFRPDLVDQTDAVLVAHRGVDGATLVPQASVEEILLEHAISLGVTVRRGVEVLRFDHLFDEATGAESGIDVVTSEGTITAGWLVGTDGGRSAIRKQAGIAFVGTDPETTGYQAIADLEGADALRPGWTWTPNGVYSSGPIPGRILTVQFSEPPFDRSVPVTKEELQASIRHVTGVDVTVTRLHGAATRWTDNARQAETYRRGRVLLAGDAAHVHSPFSGQGLNLGAGDAINLGWKLAATIRGWAPEGLLDSYDSERRPIGAWVLDWTRAQVALMRGDDKTKQLRDVVSREFLGTSAAMTRLVKLTSGVAQAYDVVDGGRVAGVSADGAVADEPESLVGRLIGDTPLADGSRLAEHFREGRFVLLDRTPSESFAADAHDWSDHLTVVVEKRPADDSTPLYRSLSGLLVRPDGVIVWAAGAQPDQPAADDDDAAAESVALRSALARWCGVAVTAPAPAR